MTHTIQLYPLPYAKLSTDLATRRSQAKPWWSGPSTTERSPVWLGAVGTVLILGMLLAFSQVVSGVVEQGKARRVANVAQLTATAACTAMRGSSAQDACRVQVAAASGTTTLIAMQ